MTFQSKGEEQEWVKAVLREMNMRQGGVGNKYGAWYDCTNGLVSERKEPIFQSQKGGKNMNGGSKGQQFAGGFVGDTFVSGGSVKGGGVGGERGGNRGRSG